MGNAPSSSRGSKPPPEPPQPPRVPPRDSHCGQTAIKSSSVGHSARSDSSIFSIELKISWGLPTVSFSFKRGKSLTSIVQPVTASPHPHPAPHHTPPAPKPEVPDVVPEEPVVGPEPSQVSSEEPEQDDMAFGEAQPSQEVGPPVSKERPIHEVPAPLVPSDHLSSLEEASNTQSEHISSSLEFPRPNPLHPVFDNPRVTPSPVPFPVPNDHEDQGYGTQEDEDRTTQVSQRAPGKHVHWGSVEAQPAYERLQDEEDPAPSVTEPQPDARPECAARLVRRRAIPPLLEKPMRKFEQGVYTVMDVRWGMALDLSNGNNRSPIAFGSHGWESQQWEFCPCGSGFIVKNVSSGSFLVLEDLQGLQETSVVVTGDFPTCWEIEVMDNGSAEDKNEDVYTRIRLPRSEMALRFEGGYAGAQLYLTQDTNNLSTYWRLRVPQREQVVKNLPFTNRVHPAGWSDGFDNNHERDNDDENHYADRYGRRMRHACTDITALTCL